jgi:hypothetical protein
MKCFLITLIQILIGCGIQLNSQSLDNKLYMPLDFRQAYEKGTRSYSGSPGINYWENTCSYVIKAEVDPGKRHLEGVEFIAYNNYSPDTLKRIIVNTYQDVYKKGSQRCEKFPDETDGVRLSLVVINGDTIRQRDHTGNTYYDFKLKEFIKPNSSVTIEIAWTVDFIGRVIEREGFVDSTAAFIGLWYPKIAVYDDIFSWNKDDYTLKDEFYSPLSDYDVSISLPAGFFVWATGKLLNPENYPKIVRERIKSAYSTDGVVSILGPTDLFKSREIGPGPWHFHADSIPDFAFCFSSQYYWDAVVLSLKSRNVLISNLYAKEKAWIYRPHTGLVRDAMEFYSNEDPGIVFPYDYYTIFTGSIPGGMEYPMLSFDGTMQDKALDADVAVHEMLHSYFPFYIHTNEAKFGWMDEGFTSIYSFKLLEKYNYNIGYIWASEKKDYSGFDGYGNLPLFTSTLYLGNDNWGGISYIKSPQMLASLEDLVGKDLWRNCFSSFVETWKHKSPVPYDFFFFVENYVKQNLSWFWDAWFMHFGYPDISIEKVDSDEMIIRNTGGLPIPFKLFITNEEGKMQEETFHADIWKHSRLLQLKIDSLSPVKIELKCDLTGDDNMEDNSWVF